MVKNLPAKGGDAGSVLGLGRFPVEGNGTRSSILAWESTWTEENDGLQSVGSQKCRTELSD